MCSITKSQSTDVIASRQSAAVARLSEYVKTTLLLQLSVALKERVCIEEVSLMHSHSYLLTLVSHNSQSHTDMVPFVSTLLLTSRAGQNRSGIEQKRRRNFYAWSPTLRSTSC